MDGNRAGTFDEVGCTRAQRIADISSSREYIYSISNQIEQSVYIRMHLSRQLETSDEAFRTCSLKSSPPAHHKISAAPTIASTKSLLHSLFADGCMLEVSRASSISSAVPLLLCCPLIPALSCSSAGKAGFEDEAAAGLCASARWSHTVWAWAGTLGHVCLSTIPKACKVGGSNVKASQPSNGQGACTSTARLPSS